MLPKKLTDMLELQAEDAGLWFGNDIDYVRHHLRKLHGALERLMSEIGPSFPVPPTAALKETLRVTTNCRQFLEAVTVRGTDAPALVECLAFLETIQARTKADIDAGDQSVETEG